MGSTTPILGKIHPFEIDHFTSPKLLNQSILLQSKKDIHVKQIFIVNDNLGRRKKQQFAIYVGANHWFLEKEKVLKKCISRTLSRQLW